MITQLWLRAALLAAGIVLVVIGAAAIAVRSGAIDVAGDAPHSGIVFTILQSARVHSIEARARGIAVPSDLTEDKRIAAGASHYAEMCAQCHLAPGMERTEIAQGLHPNAPELARGDPLTPAEQFWTVKHGIKFTAMPAWGATHEDELIWNMVAFVRKLPSLTPAQYAAMTRNAAEDHEHTMQERPGDEEAEQHEHSHQDDNHHR